MEQQLQPQPLTEKEQLKASMRLTLETSEEVESLKVEVTEVKQTIQSIVDTMRIDGNQEAQINKRAREVIVTALGGKDSKAYKKLVVRYFLHSGETLKIILKFLDMVRYQNTFR